ncbi:MAG: 2-oxo acid dehydrogenase subunit E2 [Chloroflexi bacterium]|nr:2-oxo acid dehydrogenase subunit E2 [Chloroflexota bacterium]MCC6897176.1 2-oxo acid dehydrogenase subunit E2 [Anaerolineae bacterium]
MRTEVVMPRMGQSMEEGVVLKWLKAIGDKVTRGEQLVEIETDKATVDIESFATGTLVEIIVSEGQSVAVGTVIAIVDDAQAVAAPAVETRTSTAPAAVSIPAPVAAVSAPTSVGGRSKPPRVNASPLAKRLAFEHNIDLFAVRGTGPGGRIGKEDIKLWLGKNTSTAQPAASIPVAAAAPAPTVTAVKASNGIKAPLSKMKLATARRMVESKTTAPHFYVSMDIEMTRALELRASLKARGKEVSVNDLLLKAVALALAEFPNLNSTFAGDAVERHVGINLAVAVALGEKESEGLLTPVIPNCQQLSLLEIAAASRSAIERARSGRLNADDMGGGTFTVSNLGMFGVRSFEAIVNTPQAAILAVGAVRRVPAFDAQDRVVASHLLTATVSADHRVSDGAEVARFLKMLKGYLEDAFVLVSAG